MVRALSLCRCVRSIVRRMQMCLRADRLRLLTLRCGESQHLTFLGDAAGECGGHRCGDDDRGPNDR